MCPECGGLAPRIEITQEYEYFDLLGQIRSAPGRGVLALVSLTYSVEKLQRDSPWRGDVLEHIPGCTACGGQYPLLLEKYRGSGGGWEPI